MNSGMVPDGEVIKMSKLTDLETKVLKSFNTNYDCAENEKGDNATYTGVSEIAKLTGLSLAQVKGVVGSLVKKSLADVDTHKAGAPDCLVLTDAGIDAFYA
jgi:DNA-binding MarR family transcriptional regulator